MFTGLSAFPLTPLKNEKIDEAAFGELVNRLAEAEVDSIGVLGSTGSYMYLNRQERRRVVEMAAAHAEGVPLIVGIGALRTRDVLELAEDAQAAGAAGVLLAPVSYQPLTEEEVFSLYEKVSRELSVPLCVYDNPGTTKFTFTDELHGRICSLPNIGSIKIPGVPADPEEARQRVARLRSSIPDHVTIGVSGDRFGAAGITAGCDGWYSVLGGLFPKTCLEIVQAARSGRHEEAAKLSERLEPIWSLFDQGGSLRPAAAIAILQGRTENPGLPHPLSPIPLSQLEKLAPLLHELS